jgi:threonine dehydrogenase-like Zn-dependent dehydrogenase
VDEPLQRITRKDPRAGPGQVVVDVKAAGLCHSDCGFLDGTLTWMLPGLPMILGHEVAGTIAEVGEGVSDFAVGDRVVLSGPEEFAAGWRVDGGYATKCLAMASGLIRLPDTVSFVQGAAATDAGMTAYGAVMGSGSLQPGMKVGVVGLGGLGMTGARIAVVNGAEVYGAEPRREAWDAARAMGVKEVVADVRELAPFQPRPDRRFRRLRHHHCRRDRSGAAGRHGRPGRVGQDRGDDQHRAAHRQGRHPARLARRHDGQCDAGGDRTHGPRRTDHRGHRTRLRGHPAGA